MDRIEITDALLFRYFAGQTSNEETDALSAWSNENPEEHRNVLDRAHALYVVSTMCGPDAADSIAGGRAPRTGRAKAVHYACGIAAALSLGVFGSYHFFSQKLDAWAARTTVIETPPGQHLRLTLNDGTAVDLNSGSRLTYPSIFAGKERRVKLEGEAMFDVEHDAEQPFVVETFACDVTVSGTRFNVVADETTREFSTALFEGRVSVVDTSTGQRVDLLPESKVDLKDGRLQQAEMDPDNYRWTEGVVSLSGLSFEQVLRKLEKAYGVEFAVERDTWPAIKYRNIKVRTSDGIEHALNILRKASDFTYEYDETRTTVIIR